MIDVFFCSVPYPTGKSLRTEMARLCLDRWSHETSAWVHPLTPDSLWCTPAEFQKKRRQFADANSQGQIYIVADDDCFLSSAFDLMEAVDLVEKYKQFWLLSLMPSNARINLWTPEGYTPFVDDNVMEHESAGNIRICRRDRFVTWPPQTRQGYDTDQCHAIRADGGKVGFLRNIQYTHLGEGYSSIWS